MKNRDLLKGSIPKHMIRLAIPSIIGSLSFMIFNLTDTYFVSQLGTTALAAMGFTFPVVMIVSTISGGISAGAASLLSRAKGAKNNHLMQRIATDGIFLSLVFVAFISVLGILSMDKVFTFLGADAQTLVLVKKYMLIWYSSVVVVVTPPLCDSCMRASGDMFRPFIVMTVCAVFNIILDPLLIHGYMGFPKLGIEGAALATVISRALGMLTTLYFIHFHHRLITFKINFKELLNSWKNILKIGLPSIAVLLMPQLLRSVLTILVSSVGGDSAIAAIAVGTRTEGLVRMVTAGIGMSLIPIIGQNWGAKKYDRVEKAKSIALKFAVIYGLAIFVVMLPLAGPISKIFTKNPDVIGYSTIYIRIMVFGMIGLNVSNWMSQAFTTIGRPIWNMVLNVFGITLVVLPLAFLGKYVYGYTGIFLGICLGQIIVGLIAYILSKTKMKPELVELEGVS